MPTKHLANAIKEKENRELLLQGLICAWDNEEIFSVMEIKIMENETKVFSYDFLQEKIEKNKDMETQPAQLVPIYFTIRMYPEKISFKCLLKYISIKNFRIKLETKKAMEQKVRKICEVITSSC